jgi:hypothetical protein
MIGYELCEQDKAVLACFSKAAEAEGFDGTYSLSPVERGILATVDLIRAQTLLQVFAALKIGVELRQKRRLTRPASRSQIA